MLNLKITINVETRAFDLIRNKHNLPEIIKKDLCKILGCNYSQMNKIKISWKEVISKND